MTTPFCDWLPTDRDIEHFQRDGLLVVDNLVDPQRTRQLMTRYESLFRGKFPTGISPEKWTPIDDEASTPQVRWAEKAWRSDPQFARFSLRPEPAQMIATLSGWSGARLFIDAAHWKPPGAKTIPFHRDNSYMRWASPPRMNALWIALEDVTLLRGPIVYARGSQRWPDQDSPAYENRARSGMNGFLGPTDFKHSVETAAAAIGQNVDYQVIELPAGGGVFHDGWTWHGSHANTDDQARYSLSIHCMPHDAVYSDRFNDPVESRYKRFDTLELDESYYPILWTEHGYRSPWLDDYIARAN